MDTMRDVTVILTFLTGVLCQANPTSSSSSSCPKDIVRQAMGCFSDLASGVTKGRTAQFTGSMPLDYHMIREYCQEGGHMTRFLQCIDTLQRQCESAQEAEVLLQIINPERVRSSVPNLCQNIDLIEESAGCLNREMTKGSMCKSAAKDMIKRGMAQTPRNVTAMFIVQCRFFNILAECQRTSVRANCGEKLANLHADFILSFVPNTCTNNDTEEQEDSPTVTGDVTTSKHLKTSEETATMLGVYPSKKQPVSDKATEGSYTDTTTAPEDKVKVPEPEPEQDRKEPEQVLKTLPPITEDDKLGMNVGKSRRHLDGEETDKTSGSGATVLSFGSGLMLVSLAAFVRL